MNSPALVIALDQGTTSSRAVAYSSSGERVAIASKRLTVSCPQDGWVEQSAEEIWESQAAAFRAVLQEIDPANVKAVGITNQRETTVAWSRSTGKPLCPAIVWQCRRSAAVCERFKGAGHESFVRDETGLVLDPYFSASKISWMLENYPDVKAASDAGDLLLGTVDSWILYRLSDGKAHLTEPSNASRTMLYSMKQGGWSQKLCDLFQVSVESLPEIKNSVDSFADIEFDGMKTVVRGILGDQQASLLGHGCLRPGEAKCTFGTGAFMLLHTGSECLKSKDNLLSTVSWQMGDNRDFALEGSIFIAGALIDWLCNDLELIDSVVASEAIAESVSDSGGVVVVPAFVGLGAPHWDADARGSIFGMTRATRKAHVVRAAFEGVAQQVADVLEADGFSSLKKLFIDGGMGANRLFVQILADITNKPVDVSHDHEKTARGVAIAAAYGAGLHSSLEEASRVFVEAERHQFGSEGFTPSMSASERSRLRADWRQAVERAQGWAQS